MLLPPLDPFLKRYIDCGQRIAFLHDLPQMLARQVGIQIDRDRAVGVTENLGNRFDVRSFLDRYCGEAMAEDMRCNNRA